MVKFEKYHGLGNDFLIFDERDFQEYNRDKKESERVDEKSYSQFAKRVAHRNLGIGADGVIILRKLSDTRVKMLFFNQDGSISSMCGNGIRCFSHFIYRNEILSGKVYEIETQAGLLSIEITIQDSFKARVNMGKPDFHLAKIPMDSEKFRKIYGDKEEALNYQMDTSAGSYELNSVFMGTTHTVTFVDELDVDKIKISGKEIENNLIFSRKTNVNFVKILDRKNIEMKTWETGAGLTLACGTGACASVVIGNMKNLTLEKNVTVHLPMGKMHIEIKDNIYMTGPSIFVAEGKYNVERGI